MADGRGSELRAFLRAMRARLRPEDVGLPERVSDALRLTPDEREMLTALAAPRRSGNPHSEDDTVLRVVVDGFTTGPAFVSDRFWNIQAYNATADAVYGISAAAEKTY